MLNGLIFLLGGLAFALIHWIWEAMTGQDHRKLVRDLDEYKANQENEKLIEEFFDEGLPDWDRKEIWRRMGWLWKETRGWALRSPGLLSLAALALYAVLYNLIWLKTLVRPNSMDLRLLLGGRVWVLHIAQKTTPE